MKRPVWLVGILLILSAAIVALIPAFTAAFNLLAARGALAVDAAEIDRAQLVDAKDHLDKASSALDSLPLRAIAAIPGPGDNYASIAAVSKAAARVLDRGLKLQEWREENLEKVFADGRIDLDVLDTVIEPLAEQEAAFADLEQAAAADQTGWLLPSIWEVLEKVRTRASELHLGAERASRLLEHAHALLGDPEPRTYLVMSINNAELRGGGGLLSGLGTVTFDSGKVEVGKQFPREQFQNKPFLKVPAPKPYLQRYGTFKANTTLWANVTYSPDLVDDAQVGGRLFEKQTGTDIDGALILDPRGLQALVPDGATVILPNSDRTLGSEELANWIYSDAYAEYDDQFERRAAIIEVGRAALSSALSGEGGLGSLDELGTAVSGGHIALISFDEDELAALEDLGIARSLGEWTGDYAFIAAQNFGDGHGEGTKLDFWIERRIRHGCSIPDEGPIRCATQVVFNNKAPEGLPRYVAGTPYGLLRSYVEIMIPRDAELTGVLVDNVSSRYRRYVEQSVRPISVYITIPPGEQRIISVNYELPRSDSYSFLLEPQALTQDARVELFLEVPETWAVSEPMERAGRNYRVIDTLTGPIRVTAGPDPRRGLTALWNGFIDELRSVRY